jgi:6-phosphogluconolactonase (cycloisomerase 2 family)
MDSLRTDPSNKPGNLGGHLLVEDELIWTSNRGADTLVAFRVMQGALHQVACFPSGGQSPRHLARVNKHLVAAHEKDGTVSSIDASVGNVLCDVIVPGAAFLMSA